MKKVCWPCIIDDTDDTGERGMAALVHEDDRYDIPFYDEDGNEISDEELPWNAVSDETDPNDETDDWQYDDFDSDDSDPNDSDKQSSEAALQDDRPASERRKRIAQSVREEALRRLELSARTTQDYRTVVTWYDREEQSQMRKERRHESLRGDIPLEYGALPEAEIVPHSMSQPTFRQICRGEFDDYLANCLFTMHDLTDKPYLRRIIYDLKLDHKEIVYFLGIRLYPPKKLAALRGQSERNIRKVRDTARRKIQKKAYGVLTKKQEHHDDLTHQEQKFLKAYDPVTGECNYDEDEKSV